MPIAASMAKVEEKIREASTTGFGAEVRSRTSGAGHGASSILMAQSSTFICTPAAQAQPGGYALGNQVPEPILAEIVATAGFSRFRRATETPFNRVFEVRP